MPINKPLFINTDSGVKNLQPDEALFLKDVEISINKNGNQSTGTANPSGEGQNEFVLTPTKSNILVPDYLLPSTGVNKNIGNALCKQTNETYCFTYNSLGNHCIHIINGDDGTVQRILYPYLNFTDDQEGYIADNRCLLRVIRNADNEIIEKILLLTDYRGWQKWINTLAAIGSDSFNDVTYPYWVTKQPHFDRGELVEWPTRPPMFAPTAVSVANTAEDLGVPNRILDAAFEFCTQYINTDGRETSVSPWSLPYITKRTDFLSNPDLIPKKYLLTLQAGSPLTEKVNIYARQTATTADSDLQRTFGDWYLYDTIYKFKQSKNNVVVGTRYWERTGAWEDYGYDSDMNTIEYVFDNTRAGTPVDQNIFRVETDMPQVSAALADAGDSAFLSNNRHQYDNLSNDVTEQFEVDIAYNTGDGCTPELRTVSLYAYVGRDRLNENNQKGPLLSYYWLSQIGYHVGDDDDNNKADIRFNDVIDCAMDDFTITNNRNNIVGWIPNNIAYFSSYNGNEVGVANRVLVRGTITNTDGIPLSRIAVTIQDGMTDYTDDNGVFELVVHNGLAQDRVSTIYINAGGNFTINMEDCAPVPVFLYDQSNVLYYPACRTTGDDRVYGLDIELAIEAKSGEIQSLKAGASYIITVIGHDLAGRQTFANKIATKQVPSFLQRDGGNIYGSSFLVSSIGDLNLDQSTSTQDLKYLSFYVSKNINYRKYLQWVGGSIEFIDQNGNETINVDTASLVRISIQSFLDTNIQNNFTLLSNYQFVRNDRLRIFDDGDGQLFDTATYGDVIDVEIQGTNYNQAFISMCPNTQLVLLLPLNIVGYFGHHLYKAVFLHQ